MEEQKQHRFTGKIKTDRAYLTEIFSDCSDMKMKDMTGMPGYKFSMAISALDCTGCGSVLTFAQV